MGEAQLKCVLAQLFSSTSQYSMPRIRAQGGGIDEFHRRRGVSRQSLYYLSKENLKREKNTS